MKAPRLARLAAPDSDRRSISVDDAAPCPQCGHLVGVLGRGQLVDQRVLGGDHGVGHAERGVGTGGEDPQGQRVPSVGSVAAFDHQVELGSLGAADPVPLHRLDPLGPLQLVEAGEQLVGVLGDAEEPLLEVPFDDQVARALTGAVGQDLLVGQHRLAAGAPVDRGVGPVGQAGLQQLGEDDLVPLDVLGIVAADLAAPVVDGAQRGDGLLQLLDAGVGEHPGVGAGLDGGVLRRAGRTSRSRTATARRGRAWCGAGPAGRRRCSCARGPYGPDPTGTGTW